MYQDVQRNKDYLKEFTFYPHTLQFQYYCSNIITIFFIYVGMQKIKFEPNTLQGYTDLLQKGKL